jgi:hypothetical protein
MVQIVLAYVLCRAVLVTELGKDLGHCGEADSQFGTQGQSRENGATHAGQGAKILQTPVE